jgi:hypothetical protein
MSLQEADIAAMEKLAAAQETLAEAMKQQVEVSKKKMLVMRRKFEWNICLSCGTCTTAWGRMTRLLISSSKSRSLLVWTRNWFSNQFIEETETNALKN